ncbi:26S proteasome non-ATPase regulatory subunit 6 [Heterostelium album PN500]|uniref:26S proteasome non-ATPase regulatory subunit 6 n=1 Tax=Heterostelium pallidum (strain ATCC 26659 / Pp 5 / PN500) TaxID=670386 RepID=D3B5T9_HETP5|nr:26S proteasome non-ATPase regulatory subunit 6 [Heterostelium album PN500]EFA83237.1 26S proteasome non-ATPase regulatory subunit 6 [Heterostelium album PN500]|eukprot:XP_020435354.1 26S proteasome non-ATPase regulatory subunit 6 [Heterostelium album PN500]
MEEEIKKLPDLRVSELVFLATQQPSNAVVKKDLLVEIEKYQMLPLYKKLVEQLKWEEDRQLSEKLRVENEKELTELNFKIKDAEENFGESEIREAFLAKSDYYCRIGDKDKAYSSYRQTYEKTVPLGQKLDLIFTVIRMGIFWMDHDIITRNLEKAKSLVEEGGDWDRKNRLKTYEAVYLMSIRKFKEASELYLDTLASFTSVEFIDYPIFVEYLVLTSMLHLDRVSLKTKVIDSPDVLSVIGDVPHLSELLHSYYDGEYNQYFVHLAHFSESTKNDRYLAAHSRFLTRELRILSYNQYLESYSSVRLESMSNQFGVSFDFIDRELSRFISAGRISCKIDRVSGVVETTRSDSKNSIVQKLSRVINV